MNPNMRHFLARLLDAQGPSGYEGPAAARWREEAGTFSDEVWVDVHGNSFAAIGQEGSPSVMLAGHIDEIGLMVHYIDDDGYLFVRPVGGWDPPVLVGQRVEVLTRDGPVVGVIGRRAVHLLNPEERDKAVKVKDLWIDIGSTGGEEARKKVSVGDVAVIRSDTVEIGENCIAARSVDDRIGAVVVLEALRRAAEKGTQARVVAVATTQEEISVRSGGGARTSSFGLEPDAAIVVDVTHATDHPQVDKKEYGDVRLGAGPVLSRGAVVNEVLFAGLREAAEAAGIAIQPLAAPSATGTDADSIFTSRTGVATAIVSVPNRYMHSPNQLVHVADVEGTAELIASYLAGLTSGQSFVPN
jgi:endoglucanase